MISLSMMIAPAVVVKPVVLATAIDVVALSTAELNVVEVSHTTSSGAAANSE